MIPPKKLPLVTNGVANTVIVVNAQGDWEKEARRIYVETHAAAALQAHLRQMSGTEVPIATVNTYADVPIVEGRLTPEENVADTYIILGDNALSR
ncbi:MAG: hypothetical protein K9N51_01355, partial [Candidatus Pacebacteria bacterium]|nr:hypothetical protein [Candidatus Paceibacterota bacterium]